MSRKLLAPLVLALVLPTLAPAQPHGTDAPTVQEQFEALIDRLLGRLEPGLDVLGELLSDPGGWHAPEILPNGDILIRRRAQPPEFDAPERDSPGPDSPAPDSPVPDAPEDGPPVIEPFEL